MNLYDQFCRTARRQPDRPAILGPAPGDRLTYGQLHEAVAAAGAVLGRAGVGPGSCVALHAPSGAAYIILTYGVWSRGGCVVPIPVELTPPEKERISRDIALSQVAWVGREPGFVGPVARGTPVEILPGVQATAVRPLCEPPAGFGRIGAAFVRHTSGTVGTAKGVVLSHQTVDERIRAANEVLEVGPRDRVLWLLSMSYHFAVSIVCYLTSGAAIVLPPNHLAAGLLRAARRHRATIIYGSPAHYAWLAEAPSGSPLPGLRLALSTTAGLAPQTATVFRQRFGRPVAQALGIIEVGLPFINLAFAAERPTSVGPALPAYRVRLADMGMGPAVGEIHLSGPGFLDAYYRPWRPRSAVMRDGWFRTGDVGELDADGCLFLRGRSTDVINVLGLKFFPQEVEAVLVAHPAVKEACVIARPHERLGEAPYAQVVRARAGGPTAAELLAYCRRRLAGFKVPQEIEFVASLRRTASGKVLHRDSAPARSRREIPTP